jgi:hypothetical protein
LIRKEDMWKNYLSFVKDILLKYVHFVINLITFSEKK